MNQLTSRLLLACFLLFAASFSGQAQKDDPRQASRVTTKYEKSKDVTTVRLKQFQITRLNQEKSEAPNFPLHQMDLEVSYSFAGQPAKTPPENVEFKFHVVASNYVFLKGAQVTAVLDREAEGEDRAIALGDAAYKSAPPKFNSVYEEYLIIKTPAEALSRIAKANALEFFVGPVGYRLTDIQLSWIKELASQMPRVAEK